MRKEREEKDMIRAWKKMKNVHLEEAGRDTEVVCNAKEGEKKHFKTKYLKNW